MFKLLRSPMLWQLVAGFMIGTVGLAALEPATARDVVHSLVKVPLIG